MLLEKALSLKREKHFIFKLAVPLIFPRRIHTLFQSNVSSWTERERRGGGKVPARVRLGCHICTDSCISENCTLSSVTAIAYLKLTKKKSYNTMKEYPYGIRQDDSDYINEIVFKKTHFLNSNNVVFFFLPF